ncbi:PilZ domain-containing protein [Gammaproteobacteria bacterium]|nr:PilZ domain-containing protein [Gammaproteobacteria bacterium]
MLAERRILPRYPLEFSVSIFFDLQDETKTFDVHSVNISSSSMEISCDEETIQALLAQQRYPQTCKLKFQIPGQEYTFDVESQVVTHRRLSQRQYYLVLSFVDFDDKSSELLQEYLNEMRNPVITSC